MTAEPVLDSMKAQKPVARQGGGNPVYGIGMIGAWVYYFKHATTNEERVQAFFKGLVWPAFVVYELLGFLAKK